MQFRPNQPDAEINIHFTRPVKGRCGGDLHSTDTHSLLFFRHYFALVPSFLFALASIFFFSDSDSLPFLTI